MAEVCQHFKRFKFAVNSCSSFAALVFIFVLIFIYSTIIFPIVFFPIICSIRVSVLLLKK